MIAIIAILAAMLLPSLGRARAKSQGVSCMNNGKQLQLAWAMYALDENDRIAPVQDNGGTPGVLSDWQKAWCGGTMVTSPNNTNQEVLKAGLLWKYVNSLKVYKCPADPAGQFYPNGGGAPRLRSMSCSQVFSLGSWLPVSKYRIYSKTSQVAKPVDTWTFIDEEPHSINDGGFAVLMTADDAKSATVVDYPAGYHGSACGFSFVDGHSVIHRWKSPLMYTPRLPLGNLNSSDGALVADMKWLSSVTTVPK